MLQVLERHVDFAAMAVSVDKAAPRSGRERGTDSADSAIVQSLSDEQMEFQLLNRLSFQRFAGLLDSSQIPDHTTIWIGLSKNV